MPIKKILGRDRDANSYGGSETDMNRDDYEYGEEGYDEEDGDIGGALYRQASSRTHKIVMVGEDDFNPKRKEIADYFKSGNAVYINLEKARKEYSAPILDFMGGMVHALNGDMKKISTNVYAVIPKGDEIGGDLYENDNENYTINSYS